MVPAGDATEQTVMALGQRMQTGDILIDGGNSYYKDDVRRSNELKKKGIQYIDVGTSGGVWGIDRGYCIMIGGPEAAVKRLDPIFKTLSPGPRRYPANSRAREDVRHRGGWIPLLRPFRRGAFRQDGA